jgi:hypothetical protein
MGSEHRVSILCVLHVSINFCAQTPNIRRHIDNMFRYRDAALASVYEHPDALGSYAASVVKN